MNFDFEAVEKECPWRKTLMSCDESNCAPLHWLRAMEVKDEKDG